MLTLLRPRADAVLSGLRGRTVIDLWLTPMYLANGIGLAGRGLCRWLLDGVGLDPVQEGAVADGAGVGGASGRESRSG